MGQKDSSNEQARAFCSFQKTFQNSQKEISINTSYQFTTKDCFLSLCFTLDSFWTSKLSPVSTARDESPTRMDTVPVLSNPPNRTIRNRREAFDDSESEEDEEYRPRIRPRRVTGRVAPTTPVVLYAEHQKIKELLTAYAPIKPKTACV